MAKNKKKSQKKKVQQKKGPRRMQRSNGSMALAHQICAITDPFCVHARGAKYPDGSGGRSLATTITGGYTMTADANGSASTLWIPNWTYGSLVGVVTGTTAAYTTIGAYTQTSSWSNVQSARLVSGGLRVFRVCNDMQANGLVSIVELQSSDSVGLANLTSIDFANYGETEVKNFSMPTFGEATALFKPMGSTAHDFGPPNGSSAASVDSGGWTCLNVSVTGATASVAAIRVEYILHFELTFKAGNAFASAATPTAVNNPALISASNIIQSSGSVFDRAASKLGPIMEAKAMNVAESMLGMAARRFGQMTIGTPATMMIENMAFGRSGNLPIMDVN